MSTDETARKRAYDELASLKDDLDALLKNPDVAAVLAEKGVNTSLALVIADGLFAYLRGEREAAAEDLATAAEEIGARLTLVREAKRQDPS